ncbi:MAG TPA: hypothetical protein VH331_04620 [Allosphingosinicella sp.]|jgi:hypothetical protein|nr:hypothetical protein [Allosphingosinicella sp.]
MIVRGFKSVLWVGAVGGAALSCYMVSLRVATERADLVRVERQIVDTKRDIRSLETELNTRGRLTQLEDWNSNVLALSAPTSSQFAKDGYQLAQLATHGTTVEDRTGNVRMAAAETGQAAAPATPDAAPQAKTADASKPIKVAPATPAPQVTPIPRIVEAVAPAPRETVPVRRASFVTTDTPAAPAQPKPVKATHVASAADSAGAAPKPAAHATTAPAKKVKTAAKSGDVSARHVTQTALADTKAPAKARGSAKLAHADAAPHLQSSGHRGGAQ